MSNVKWLSTLRFNASCTKEQTDSVHDIFKSDTPCVKRRGLCLTSTTAQNRVPSGIEQVYYRKSSMSSILAWGADSPPLPGKRNAHSSPCLKDRGLLRHVNSIGGRQAIPSMIQW